MFRREPTTFFHNYNTYNNKVMLHLNYLQNICKNIKYVKNIVENNKIDSNKNYKNQKSFNAGEYVWVRKHHRDRKLDNYWIGLFRIIKKINDILYKVDITLKIKTINHYH